MQQMNVMIQAAEEGAHIVNELPMPGYWFGIIAFVVFIAMFVIVASFGPRSQSPDATDHHVDPAALPADEARLLADYSSKRGF